MSVARSFGANIPGLLANKAPTGGSAHGRASPVQLRRGVACRDLVPSGPSLCCKSAGGEVLSPCRYFRYGQRIRSCHLRRHRGGLVPPREFVAAVPAARRCFPRHPFASIPAMGLLLYGVAAPTGRPTSIIRSATARAIFWSPSSPFSFALRAEFRYEGVKHLNTQADQQPLMNYLVLAVLRC